MRARTSALSNPRNVVRNRTWRKSRGLTFMRRSPAGAAAFDRVRPGSNMAFPEDGRAEPNNRGSFLHGDFEVVTHAHRQLPQHRPVEALAQECIPKGSEGGEIWAGIFRLVEERRNGHQPDASRRPAAGSPPDDVHGLVLGCAVLGRFSSEVDLYEQLRRGSRVGRRGIDRIEQPPAVYGVKALNRGTALRTLFDWSVP